MTKAVPALQAIGTLATSELLIVAPARNQRVIPGIALELLTIAVPAQQAIGIIAAGEFPTVAPARD